MSTRRILYALAAVLWAAPVYAGRPFQTTFDSKAASWNPAKFSPPGNGEYVFDNYLGSKPNINTSGTTLRTAVCAHGTVNAGMPCVFDAQCGIDSVGFRECRSGASVYPNRANAFFAGDSTLADKGVDFIKFYNAAGTILCSARLFRTIPSATASPEIDQISVSSQYGAGANNFICDGGINDGTPCDAGCLSDADCTGIGTEVCPRPGAGGVCQGVSCAANDPGELDCIPGQSAGFGGLLVQRHNEISLVQDVTGAGTLSCDLVVNGEVFRGSSIQTGVCSITGWACGQDTDCGFEGNTKRCSGWTAAGDPNGDDVCNTGADCPGVETCVTQTCALIPDLKVTRMVVGPENGAASTAVEIGANYIAAPGDDTIALHGIFYAQSSTTWAMYVDDLFVDDAPDSVGDYEDLKAVVMETLAPTGDILTELSRTGCSGAGNFNLCVNDLALTGTADASDYLSQSATNLKAAIFTLSDMATAHPDSTGGEGYVSAVVIAKDPGTTATNWGNQNVRLCLGDAGCSTQAGCIADVDTACSPIVDIANEDATNGVVVAGVSKDFGTRTNVNAARIYIDIDTTSCASSCPTRVSDLLVSASYNVSMKPPPGVVTDDNGDGTIRITEAGDSVFNTLDLRRGLILKVGDLESLVVYTQGGRTTGDLKLATPYIVDGIAGGPLNGRSEVGGIGKPDKVITMFGANDLPSGSIKQSYCSAGASVGELCESDADCGSPNLCEEYDGYCWGGPNHGTPAPCSQNSSWANSASIHYCLNHADGKWLTENTGPECSRCVDDADCESYIACTVDADCTRLNGASILPSTCDVAAGFCIGQCQFSLFEPCDTIGNPDHTNGQGVSQCSCSSSLGVAAWQNYELPVPPVAPDWSKPGCKDVPGCSPGIVLAYNSWASIERNLDVFRREYEARNSDVPTTNDFKWILATEAVPLGNHPQANGFWAGFAAHAPTLSGLASLQRDYANRHRTQNNMWFVDVAGFTHDYCRDFGGGVFSCWGDPVHPSKKGDDIVVSAVGTDVQTEILAACLNQKFPFSAEAAGTRTHDGTCSTEVCTTGRIGNPCSSDWDCSYFWCEDTF